MAVMDRRLFTMGARWRAGAALAAGLLACTVGAGGGGVSAAAATLYVSQHGRAGAADTSCASAAFPAVMPAVAAAPVGATIVVCPGTYAGGVAVVKPVTLTGEHAVIDAAGHDNGFTVVASGATVQGFVVEGAIGEGILAVGKPGHPVADVTIRDNLVEGNDRGNPDGAPLKSSPYRECNAQGLVPGDCGEGIHLMVAVHSQVIGNTVVDNAGGILLTDEFGPNAYNTVADNIVMDNVYDCGITLASHSGAGFHGGVLHPTAGGIYDNLVAHNTLFDNGTKGQGAGVLMAGGLPGAAVYSNRVLDNTIDGNGLAGVTMHGHVAGMDMNGNVISGNIIGTNNLDGDRDFTPHTDLTTTGIIVATVSPVRVTITGNRLAGDAIGVWETGPVTVVGLASNTVAGVGRLAVTAS
jgi:parallel beta-helix repeat protein